MSCYGILTKKEHIRNPHLMGPIWKRDQRALYNRYRGEGMSSANKFKLSKHDTVIRFANTRDRGIAINMVGEFDRCLFPVAPDWLTKEERVNCVKFERHQEFRVYVNDLYCKETYPDEYIEPKSGRR